MASLMTRNRGWIAALLVIVLPMAAEAVTVPQWQDVAPLCLPSRVSKDSKIDGCVCPPQSQCPSVAGITSMQQLINASLMPPALTVACCTLPVCPAGTTLAGSPLPADGNCNVVISCPPGFAPGTYDGPYQAFEFGAAVGPAIGTVNFTGCLPICEVGDNLFATTSLNPGGGVGGVDVNAVGVNRGQEFDNGELAVQPGAPAAAVEDALVDYGYDPLLGGYIDIGNLGFNLF
jgi:hypothetical protein